MERQVEQLLSHDCRNSHTANNKLSTRFSVVVDGVLVIDPRRRRQHGHFDWRTLWFSWLLRFDERGNEISVGENERKNERSRTTRFDRLYMIEKWIEWMMMTVVKQPFSERDLLGSICSEIWLCSAFSGAPLSLRSCINERKVEWSGPCLVVNCLVCAIMLYYYIIVKWI